jgi:gliding motility-associated-like protein
VLTVRNNCGQLSSEAWDANSVDTNYLSWSYLRDTCSYNIIRYHVYYSANDSVNFTLIDSLGPKDDTTFNHLLNDNLAGCYAVTAVDRAGNESKYSNIVCVDNCPIYELPNSFTPNGDGSNDRFTPFHPYRFVPKIEIKIYNRWGEEVFETADPEINWNGKDWKTGNDCTEGVYLYAGYYYEQRLGGLVKKPLGKSKGGGYIHLIRK